MVRTRELTMAVYSGSCAQLSNAAAPLCSNPIFSPKYSKLSLSNIHRLAFEHKSFFKDYQFLPPKAPTDALPREPPATTPGFFVASIVFSFIFFILSFIASLAEMIPVVPGFISRFANNGIAARVVAWLGVLGFTIGLMCTIIWRISFGRDVQEFNDRNFDAGADAVQLLARLGNGMTSKLRLYGTRIREDKKEYLYVCFISAMDCPFICRAVSRLRTHQAPWLPSHWQDHLESLPYLQVSHFNHYTPFCTTLHSIHLIHHNPILLYSHTSTTIHCLSVLVEVSIILRIILECVRTPYNERFLDLKSD